MKGAMIVFLILICSSFAMAQEIPSPLDLGQQSPSLLEPTFRSPSQASATSFIVKLDFDIANVKYNPQGLQIYDSSMQTYKANTQNLVIPYEILKGCYAQYFDFLKSRDAWKKKTALSDDEKTALRYAASLKDYLKSESKFGVAAQECTVQKTFSEVAFNLNIVTPPATISYTPETLLPQENVNSVLLKQRQDCETIIKIAASGTQNKNTLKAWQEMIKTCKNQFPSIFGKNGVTFIDRAENFFASGANDVNDLDSLARTV